MRQVWLATVSTSSRSYPFNEVMRSPHSSFRFRSLLLGNCHKNIQNDDLTLLRRMLAYESQFVQPDLISFGSVEWGRQSEG
jgi:hypothetical protein